MIKLTPASLVGKGLHREVHVHPEDSSRCIKVVVNRGVEETRREQAYYRFLQKKQVSWEMLPRFHGNIETSMGSGAVFDLIRDSDGQVSKTLEFYLEQEAMSDQHLAEIVAALLATKSYLLRENIITMSIKPKNMVLQRVSGAAAKCFIIDNIGNSDVFPISSYSRLFGGKKIERKWAKFKQLLTRQYPDKVPVSEIVAKI
jgi:hypothetical protein